MSNIKVVHQGKSGYVELQGKRYSIEVFAGGHFLISFPCGNRHSKLQEHLEVLKEFAKKQNPEWAVENKSRKYN